MRGRAHGPRRAAPLAALAVVGVIVAALIVNSGEDSGYRYHLLFQNGSQLVNGNQVMIGGAPVGKVESIERTDDNLAEVEISIDRQLHDGTTAAARFTSLTGVANRIVSVHPGPNSNAPLEDGATLGLASTESPVEIDQLFNTFKPRVRRGLADFIQGSARVYAGKTTEANETYKYFFPALQQTDHWLAELNSDEAMFEQFVIGSSKLVTAIGSRSDDLSSSVTNARTAFGAIAEETESLDQALAALPGAFRQSNTTFYNLRAALDDVDPLVAASLPATEELGAYMRNDLRPVVKRAVPVFKKLAPVVNRPGAANDANELLRSLPKVRPRAATAFPQSEKAIDAFQPTLDFARASSPDIMNALTKLGQITAYYDANGHYARVMPANLNLFEYNSGTSTLDPIPPSDQFNPFGPPAILVRCPGAASQSAPDNSNPFVNPPWPESGLDSTDCNPADLPPGP